jgi:hypothetical protein
MDISSFIPGLEPLEPRLLMDAAAGFPAIQDSQAIVGAPAADIASQWQTIFEDSRNTWKQRQWSSNDFKVFDSLKNSNKPDLFMTWGLNDITVLYEGSFFPNGMDRSQPDEQIVRQLARSLAPNTTVCLDIECWEPWYYFSSSVNTENIAKFVKVADWFHEENPTVKLGFFGIAPLPEMAHRAYLNGPDSWQYTAWKAANEQVKTLLAPHVDYLFPEYYARYKSPADMQAVGAMVLQEAATYGVPVLPFVWDYYWRPSQNMELNLTPVPLDVYRAMLDTTRLYANGVVLWGGVDVTNDQYPSFTWNSSAPSAVATREFLLRNNILPNLISMPDIPAPDSGILADSGTQTFCAAIFGGGGSSVLDSVSPLSMPEATQPHAAPAAGTPWLNSGETIQSPGMSRSPVEDQVDALAFRNTPTRLHRQPSRDSSQDVLDLLGMNLFEQLV